MRIIAPGECYSEYRYFQQYKYSYDRYPNPVYFNTLFLIMHLSAIETLICQREIHFDSIHFLRFCTKYDTWFAKYRIELIVALSSTNTTKSINNIKVYNINRNEGVLKPTFSLEVMFSPTVLPMRPLAPMHSEWPEFHNKIIAILQGRSAKTTLFHYTIVTRKNIHICCHFTKRQNFRLVQIESICRRQNKCDWKIEIDFWEE